MQLLALKIVWTLKKLQGLKFSIPISKRLTSASVTKWFQSLLKGEQEFAQKGSTPSSTSLRNVQYLGQLKP